MFVLSSFVSAISTDIYGNDLIRLGPVLDLLPQSGGRPCPDAF